MAASLIEQDARGRSYSISPPPLAFMPLTKDGKRFTVQMVQAFAKRDPKGCARYLSSLDPEVKTALLRNWWFMGRCEQLLPAGDDWAFWLYLAGRGAGKTRTGAETTRELIKRGYDRLGLIAPTAADTRDVMVEGESGILASCYPDDRDHRGNLIGRPLYEPSKRRLTWANGAQAALYSADEPERLRGPQHQFIWADELCAWRYPETWDLAMFGLRLGEHPRAFISTTPKPAKLIIDLMKDPSCVVTRGSTYDNRANLAEMFFKQVVAKFQGTRLGRQELDGELLEESEGALWTRAMLDETRAPSIPDGNFWFKRIVVAIDPATTADKDSDETGIVVTGVGSDDHGYVLADYSGRYTPAQWAKRSAEAYHTWQADRIVAESNQGGLMVEHTLRSVDRGLPISLVHASKGKAARAEPISALFEQRRAHIVGSMQTLEDQLCVWEPLSGKASPDRLDAMVWGLTACMVGKGESGEGKLAGAH
jgi:phage terminase large subunit-like protein